MRNYRDNREDSDYGNYDRTYNQQNPEWQNQSAYQRQDNSYQRDSRRESEEYYRMRQNQEYGSRRGDQGTREDYYMSTYDISNYEGVPRSSDYGLPHGPVDELDSIRPYPLAEGPYPYRENYRYTQGYNANYDNPEEGDSYRDFDSRGNHGYRHDPGYGSTDEFREFGNDHYGRADETGNRNYGYLVRNGS